MMAFTMFLLVGPLLVIFAAEALSKYQTLGCFKDQAFDRAIPTLEGQDPILDGFYWVRQNPIEKCHQAAKKRGFKVFAVQHGGWCSSSAIAELTYNKYGPSSWCMSDGKGGFLANQVYEIQDPATIVLSPSKETKIEGQNVTLKCQVETGKPAATVQWFKDGDMVNSTRDDRITENEQSGTWSLIITNLNRTDEGSYICQAQNDVENVSSAAAPLVVNYAAKILSSPSKETKIEGQNVTLQCKVEPGKPKSTVQWLKYGDMGISTGDDRITENEQSGTWSLIITNLNRTDEGSYICQAKNDVENVSSAAAPLVVNYAAKILLSPSKETKIEGQNVTLQCQVEPGKPAATVQWFKDGGMVDSTGDDRITENEQSGTWSLTITNLNRTDKGNYACQAQNDVENVSSAAAHLVVNYPAKILSSPSQETEIEGQNVTLKCQVETGKPAATVHWFKDGSMVNSTRDDRITENEQSGTWSLIITNLNRTDEGNYTCQAQNDVQIVSSAADASYLTVNYGPDFTVDPENREVQEGKGVILSCACQGQPTPEIVWKKYDISLNANEQKPFNIFRTGSTSRLEINPVSRLDEGRYSCEANNSFDTATSKTAMLKVNYVPEVVLTHVYRGRVVIKSLIDLHCSFNASEPAAVLWKNGDEFLVKNRKVVINDSRIYVNNQSSYQVLNINSSKTEDGGSYTCFVTNSAGNSSATEFIIIQTAPDPPTNITLNSKSTRRVTISWLNGFDGNSNILDYKVVITHGGEEVPSITCDGTTSDEGCITTNKTVVIGKLYPFRDYQIKVTARNAVGVSGNSSQLNVTTGEEEPTKPPSNIRGHNSSSTSILVQWENVPRADQNGAILGYRVKYNKSGETFRNLSGSDIGNHTLSKLNEFTIYKICVLAFTIKGDGPESCILVVTAEDKPNQPPNNVQGDNSSSTSILVQWDEVPYPDQNGIILGYRVKYNKSGEELLENLNGSGNRQQLLDGLNEFTMYNICVLTFTVKGDGPHECILVVTAEDRNGSQTCNSVVTAEDRPAKPPNHVRGHNTSSTSILVQWGEVPQADQNGVILGYRINYANTRGGWSSKQVNGLANRNLTLEELNDFTTYNICVLAFTVKGDGPQTCILVVTAEDRPAQPPNHVRGHNTSSTSILVQWGEVPQADQNGVILGYRINYANTRGGWSSKQVNGLANRNLTLEELNNFTTYNICVLAFTVKGDGPQTCILVVTAEDRPAQPPNHVRGHNTSSTSILVQWGEVPQADQNGVILGYRINYANTRGGWSSKQVNGLANRNLTLEELNDFTTYNICVLAFTVKGDGPQTCISVVTAEDRPAKPPSNLRGHNTSSTSILVQWDNVPQADQNGIILGYHLNYANTSGGGSSKQVNSLATRNLALDGLNKFTSYNICVLAFTVKGDGPQTCILVFTAADSPAKPPSNVRGYNMSSTSILVQWDEVPYPDQNGVILGYRVKYNKSGEETFKNLSSSGNRQQTLGDLNEFTIYEICVLAFTVEGDGPESCILVVTAEDNPSLSPQNFRGFAENSTSIFIQWDEIPPLDQNGVIKGYRIIYRTFASSINTSIEVDSSKRELLLVALVELMYYSICVSAFTSKGDGPFACIVVLTDSSPEFIAHPSNVTVIKGEEVTLSCTARGRPTPTIVWKKDGRVLDLRVFNVFSARGTSRLQISSVSKSDHGKYSCRASNIIGIETSYSGMLTVNYGPEVVIQPLNAIVVEGQKLTLSCTAWGRPTPDFVWKKDGALLNANQRRSIVVTGSTSILQISPVLRSDQGGYSCQANNSVNVTYSKPGNVIVNYPPKIFTSPGSQIKNETQDMSMNCTLEGKPRSDVKWLKDNKELATDNRMTLTNTNNTWFLTISNLRGEDGGLYVCEATNKVGRVTSRPGTLDVYYPPSVKKQLKYMNLTLGAELKLDCGATGNPFPNITWTKDSSSKIPNARFSDRKQVLTVDSVRVDDIGVYQCTARNLLGFMRSNIASVDVETFLAVVNKGEHFTATEGDRVKLRCVASSLVTPTTSWKRGSKRLESKEQEESRDGKVVSGYLIIENVKIEDAGQYVCVAWNGPKFDEGKIELTVNVKVEVEVDLKLEGEEFSKELKNSSSPEFKELALEFETELSVLYQNTTGFIRVEVLEFRNGSVDVRFRVILEIKVKKPEEAPAPDVKVKVTKVIVVKVTESKGKIGKLKIKPESIRAKVEPPDPQNLTIISVQRKEIQIKWSPPQFHEIYDVLQYLVELKKFGKEWEEKKTKNDHIKTYRLTDLEADTKYLLRVSAVNKYGTSIPSTTLAKKTPPVPEESYWEILLPVLVVAGVLFLLFIVYFCFRQRRIRSFYPNHLPEEGEIEIYLQQLNYACGDVKSELSGEDDLAQRSLRGAWWEIPRNALVLGEELGSGMFGQVVKAWLQRESGESQVCAVKMLKANATELEYRDLVNEVEIMINVGEHPNLVNLIGVCSVKGPLYVVVEFAENGSLLEYLRQNRSNDSIGLSNIDKFIIAFGVAKGMNHLTFMKCVHRDLSARNVLLGKDMTPKVADFGLSRDVYERGFYEKTTGGKLPTRWMAIEALERFLFTSEGDVWSFGVLLWEIETGGKLPYAGMEVKQFLKQLKSGYRLEKPKDCTDEIHDIMMWCWRGDPAKRPTFQDLCSALETLINGKQQKARPFNTESDADDQKKY